MTLEQTWCQYQKTFCYSILHELSLFEMTFYQALKQVNYCTYFLIEIFLALICMELKNFKG